MPDIEPTTPAGSGLREQRKLTLKRMLQHPRYRFRSFPRLASGIQADNEETLELLLELGARRSLTGDHLWTLSPEPEPPPPAQEPVEDEELTVH